jgi:selenide,water dikinase
VSATVYFDKVPLLPNVKKYWEMDCVPGGTRRNFESYGALISPMNAQQQDILCDAQTSGGLLCAVKKAHVADFLNVTKKAGLELSSIGELHESGEYRVVVQ